jgi:hypothetical protein
MSAMKKLLAAATLAALTAACSPAAILDVATWAGAQWAPREAAAKTRGTPENQCWEVGGVWWRRGANGREGCQN